MIQLNQQVPEKYLDRNDGILEVHSVFYTIQGEGPFAGMPAVFVRLAGCNLQCPDCDTEYTSKRSLVSPIRLVADINHCLKDVKFRGAPLIVITGGEPFRQNIWPAYRELVKHNFTNIQIETNGTMAWPDDEYPVVNSVIVCSPKKSYVHDKLRPYVKHLKYVCDATSMDPRDGLPRATMGYGGAVARPWDGFSGTIWLQPLDAKDPEQNKNNVAAAVGYAMRFGYRVSLQTHKILGVE